VSSTGTLRRFNSDDIPKITEFRRSFPLSPLVRVEEPEYHRWKCDGNPAQPGYIWLVEDGGRVVSTASMTPKRMKILDDEVLAAETGDTFTLPEYQGKGLFTSLVKNTTGEAVRKGIDFIYGLPNANSLPGYIERLSYGRITSPALYYLGRPLNIKKVLRQKIGYRWLADVLSLPLEIISKGFFKLAAVGIGRNDISVTQVTSFPEDIDRLWERVSSNYDVMLVRNRDYLEWRFVNSPGDYVIFVARGPEGETAGYLVARIADENDRRVGYIADFLSLEDNHIIFKELFYSLLEVLGAKEVDIISTWAMKGSFYYKALVRLGFLPWTKIPLICFKSELGNRILSKTYKWHFTFGDCDGI